MNRDGFIDLEVRFRPEETGLVPGDPEGSLLYRKLVDRLPPIGAQMPLERVPLEPFAVELVRRWIAEGARDR